MRRCVLVYGPPCGGKSSYVQRHRDPDDAVLDLDVLAQMLGSPKQWIHSGRVMKQANALMERYIGEASTWDGTTWIVRCVPTQSARETVAARAQTTEVVACVPDLDEALARSRRDHRPFGTERAIRQWYRRWEADRDQPGPSLDTSEDWLGDGRSSSPPRF